MKKLFFGGVHPDDRKQMSAAGTSFVSIIPDTVVIPMRQHIGAPCQPLVKVGDTVKLGQKIGDGEGLCVPVHASVSGTVMAVEERLHPTLGSVLSVVIENDKMDTAVTQPLPETDDEILSAIREAGIVGMGGAAFPSSVKALSSLGKVDTLIANGCECEPYITADDLLLRTVPEKVLEGMMILSRLFKVQKTVLAVEDNKKEAIAKVRSVLRDYPAVALRVLPTRYPQGAEKQLVQSVTGREVPPGQLPASVGCAVFNVSTFAAIYDAVKLGKPLTERFVTVSGEAVAHPQNFLARIGTSVAVLIEAAGGLSENVDRVLSGGPMMGFALKELNVPTVKACNAVTCLEKDKNAGKESACLRCGKCMDACPMRLQPLYIYRYAKAGDLAQMQRLHPVDCIECGSCAYACPAHLPLVEGCRIGKKMLKEANR